MGQIIVPIGASSHQNIVLSLISISWPLRDGPFSHNFLFDCLHQSIANFLFGSGEGLFGSSIVEGHHIPHLIDLLAFVSVDDVYLFP